MVDIYILNLAFIGLLLLAVTLGSGLISRLPLSFSIIYLGVGIGLGPYGLGLINLRQTGTFNAEFLERLTELVVIISVFGCGLKIVRPLQFNYWKVTTRLLLYLMPFSILVLALVARFFLNMSWSEGILLGAILAPTDPVLASEVQLTDVNDRDELRFGLTSEGGLNDALAFPFVYFGLYGVKDSDWFNWLGSWLLVDLFWGIFAGIAMGLLIPQAIVLIDRKVQKLHKADELMEDFIALSIILLTYSLTEIVNGYGFIAVFVAGLVVQRGYRKTEKGHNQLRFVERLEKLLEIVTILVLGSILLFEPIGTYFQQSLIVMFSLFLIIRPLGVWLSTFGKLSQNPQRPRLHGATRLLFGWFGIRGVGSLYYLAYAFGHGLKDKSGEQIGWIVYTTVMVSVILHGVTATPLMNWYEANVVGTKPPVKT
ncbi:MAG: K(+)/H(+) antiporter NhaP [Chroococcopsis gigantea SAG 12.99]|jgi:NhaP-type Na+/H+ or K+/H+ antiporter|nr:sodium:proton antiporter [Chlorogloea purpurea SAG 13.99]MDV2999410.1 K(+)/H(+) antiporter NhaP [Chroococcopsis gigantea SAG 12.99]